MTAWFVTHYESLRIWYIVDNKQTASSGVGISWPYFIQLTKSCLVCDPLRVSQNLIPGWQLTIMLQLPYRRGEELWQTHEITSRIFLKPSTVLQCVACDRLWVSENLIPSWQLTIILQPPYRHAEGWHQFHNNPASLWQTRDISSGIFLKPSTVLHCVALWVGL